MRRIRYAIRLAAICGAVLFSGCKAPWIVTDLHDPIYAGDVSKLRSQIQAGLSVNAADGLGRSLLYVAALNGKAEIAEFLLDAGANPNQPASWKGNSTPLHAATQRGEWRVVEILVSRNAKVDVRNNRQATPLHYAAWAGYLKTTQVLLAAGANPLGTDSYGRSVLHYQAVYAEVQAISDRVASEQPNYKPGPERPDYKAVMEILIKAGALVNATAKTPGANYTPLMAACASAPVEVVELLLANGADVNLETDKRFTAYEIAKSGSRTNVMELLISHGFKP